MQRAEDQLFSHDLVLQALIQYCDVHAASGERPRRKNMIKKHGASGVYDAEATSFLDTVRKWYELAR